MSSGPLAATAPPPPVQTSGAPRSLEAQPRQGIVAWQRVGWRAMPQPRNKALSAARSRRWRPARPLSPRPRRRAPPRRARSAPARARSRSYRPSRRARKAVAPAARRLHHVIVAQRKMQYRVDQARVIVQGTRAIWRDGGRVVPAAQAEPQPAEEGARWPRRDAARATNGQLKQTPRGRRACRRRSSSRR